MSIYRRKLRSGKRSKLYTAEFQFQNQPYRRGGFPDRETAKFWVNTEQLRLRRGDVGYTKPMRRALVMPLIEAFVQHLTVQGRDEAYLYTVEKRLKRLAGECGWLTLGHVSAASVNTWLASEVIFHKRKIGAKTKNQFAQLAREFGQWLVRVAQKLPANPLEHVALLKTAENVTYRRAASIAELDALLAVCDEEKRLAYLFVIYHPLRMRAIRRLTWRMLNLDATPPWALIPAPLNKSRRAEKSPLRYDVASLLRKARGAGGRKAKADELVFPQFPTLEDLKADLARAGVAFDDGRGDRRLDFHAIRKTFIRLCKLSGVSLDAASLLLHHRDVRTTRRHYDDDAVDPVLTEVLEKLPTLGQMRRAQ